MFDQLDIIAALAGGNYLTGPYAAIQLGGQPGDNQTSVGYNPETGELFVDAPSGTNMTSINIDSAAAVFTGDPAQDLGGSFDNDADNNIFKATFGSSFGSLSFGNVAQTGLSEQFVLNDLTVHCGVERSSDAKFCRKLLYQSRLTFILQHFMAEAPRKARPEERGENAKRHNHRFGRIGSEGSQRFCRG